MKRKLTIMIISIIMLGGASFIQTADAHEMRHGERGMNCDGGMHGMMRHDRQPMWRHLKDLGLDEKQKTEIREIRDRVLKETIRKKADERIAGLELRELVAKDTVDMEAVQAKLKQIESLRTDIHLAHIKAREEIKSKLTPEQRKKFNEVPAMRHSTRGRMTGEAGPMIMPWSKEAVIETPGGPESEN